MILEQVKLLPCPFCGRNPNSVGRPATPGETEEDRGFVHFISCFCGGYSACAHKMGKGNTIESAERIAAEKWNQRHTVNKA